MRGPVCCRATWDLTCKQTCHHVLSACFENLVINVICNISLKETSLALERTKLFSFTFSVSVQEMNFQLFITKSSQYLMLLGVKFGPSSVKEEGAGGSQESDESRGIQLCPPSQSGFGGVITETLI